MTIMPTLLDLHDHLLLVQQQITPSVPGILPPDRTSDPALSYWFGLISFSLTVATVLAYFLGIKSPFAKQDAAPAPAMAPPLTAAAHAEAPHDPFDSMYWDAMLTNFFEGIKRIEHHVMAIAANDASLREAVLRAAQEARHGVAAHMQQHTAVQERNHDENSHAIDSLSREISAVSNHIGSQIAGLSGQLNALAVTLGKIETLAENTRRSSSR